MDIKTSLVMMKDYLDGKISLSIIKDLFLDNNLEPPQPVNLHYIFYVEQVIQDLVYYNSETSRYEIPGSWVNYSSFMCERERVDFMEGLSEALYMTFVFGFTEEEFKEKFNIKWKYYLNL